MNPVRALFVITIFLSQVLYAQHAADFINHEGINSVTDSTIRAETDSVMNYMWNGNAFTISNLSELRCSFQNKRSIVFKEHRLLVSVEIDTFISSGHHLEYSGKELYKIDGNHFWGTDGTIPNSEISLILIILNNDSISIPVNAYNDLFNPNLCYTEANKIQCYTTLFRSKNKKRMYLTMLNSDGAGAYFVCWVFQNGKYLTRIVDEAF
jgi:hypothetical protein